MKRQKIEARETIGINQPVVTPNGKEYARLVEVVPRYIYCADCLKALSTLEESLIEIPKYELGKLRNYPREEYGTLTMLVDNPSEFVGDQLTDSAKLTTNILSKPLRKIDVTEDRPREITDLYTPVMAKGREGSLKQCWIPHICLTCFREQTEQTSTWYDIPHAK
tara:strand:- start:911 stop:1405 length:495 start_codon:yes stop_codon:yes gene_type:complete